MDPAGSNDEIATFTGYGDDIYEDGTYRYKVEIKDADGSIDTIYTGNDSYRAIAHD